MNIKILETIQEFNSSFSDERTLGIYKVEIDSSNYFVTRNGDKFFIICHMLGGDTLQGATNGFRDGMLEILSKESVK